MSRPSFLPPDAELTEYLPGRWHVRLNDGLPRFSVVTERDGGGWLTFTAGLPHAGGVSALVQRDDLVALLDLQERFRGLRLALPDTESGLELRCDVPLPAGAHGPALDAWQTLVFEHFVETRRILSGAPHGVFGAPGSGAGAAGEGERNGRAAPAPLEAETVAQLQALGELSADHAEGRRLQVMQGDGTLGIDVRQRRGWLTLDALLDAGSVSQLREPCGRALTTYLLRVAARLRMARPIGPNAGAADHRRLGFRVDLPAAGAAIGLEAAVEALATAETLFGAEIGQLASEVILAKAYLVVSGSAVSAANSNREL